MVQPSLLVRVAISFMLVTNVKKVKFMTSSRAVTPQIRKGPKKELYSSGILYKGHQRISIADQICKMGKN
ncbi:MAG: hypothetical protein C4320_06740 [Armatimonadota bacterium]